MDLTGLPRYVHLTGMIESTTKLTPAPGADPLIIPTKAYLVNGTALIKDDRAKIMGTLSWQLNGETHLSAGRLSGAISGGIHAFRIPCASGFSARTTQPFDVNTLDTPEVHTLPASDAPANIPSTHLASTTEMPQLGNLLTETQTGWAQAKAATSEQEDDSDIELRRGDVLLHPRFGPCRVVRVPSFGKVKVRRENGAFLDLHMKIIHLSKANDPRFERAFTVAIGKPAG